MSKLQENFTDKRITSNDLHPIKERTEKTLTGFQLKIKTYKFTKPVEVLVNASKVFKKSGTKKRGRNLLSNSIEMSLRILPKYVCIFYRMPLKINDNNEINTF